MMQKRSEANKQVKLQFRKSLKRTAALVLCLLFAYSAIYAADVSNKRMLNKRSEDRYALRLSMADAEQLRIDLAGTKHYVNIGETKLTIKKLSDKMKEVVGKLKEEAGNLLENVKN